MIKKYILSGLLIWLGITASAQVMLPAYQGVFSRKILSSSVASNGLDFDGVDDYISISNNTVIPLANSQYTLEAYIKPTIHSTNGIVGWGSWGSSNQANALRLNGGNGIFNYWWGNDLYVVLDASLADNNWYHLAATYDGTKRRIYVNGVLKGEDTPSGHNVPSAANFRIGSTNNGEFFKGTIDDVRIWNVARTQAEIQASMNTELTGNEAGLKAYYTFNQGIATGDNTAITTVMDKTANGLVGTLTNFAKTGATSNFVLGKVETTIITNGLILNLDAGNSASYTGSGTIWKDLSGLGNNGTLINSPSYNSANGGNLVFNGSNTYVSAPLTKTASCTFSAWAKSSSLPTESMLFNAGNNGSGPDLFLSFGIISWNTWDSSNNPFGNIPATAGNGIWHHYVLVNDAVANHAKLYYDGVLYGTAAYRTAAATTTLYIGGNNSAYMWNGAIATFSVYNRSLIASEVLQNYNAQKGRFGL